MSGALTDEADYEITALSFYMAIRLEDAISLASEPVEAFAIISMHDNIGVVAVGSATPTFRADLPLLNWGASDARGGRIFFCRWRLGQV
jgi:hypothetical protein